MAILKQISVAMRSNVLAKTLACCSLFASASALAEWNNELGIEGRWHWQSPADPAQYDANLSLDLLSEYFTSWDGGRQSLVFKPFVRLDQGDPARTHADLREAVWTYAADDWEFRAGVDKVFWGVTESNHLVDIINQTDALENPDGEAKLGQPMLKVSIERDWGTLDAFVMPWFRERAFIGREGRLRTQPRVDDSQSVIHAGLQERYPALALRWSQSIGDWDIGLSQFHGLSREPRFQPALDAGGNPVLAPHYDVIDQSGLDLQATKGDWLWKLESIYRSGQGKSYWAASGGFEYTLVGINDSAADLGMLLEVSYDSRGDTASSPSNHDVFVGLRWVANDEPGTEVLGGMQVDWEQGSRFFNIEASRRMGENWKASLQVRAWNHVAATDPVLAFSRDDYAELRLIRYF